VYLFVPREIPRGVVEDSVSAQPPDQLHVVRAANRRRLGTEALQQLDRRWAYGSGGTIDEDVLPDVDLRRPDVRQGIVRTLGTGCGLLLGHVRRHGRERAVLGDRHVLGVSTERALVVPEHSVAGLERRDATADRLDYSRKLSPEDLRSGPCESGEESHEEGPDSPVGAVCPIHRRRANLDEHLVVPGSRLLTSEIRATSGGPYLVWTAAFMPGL
jgi:hypothetical protein